MNRFQFHPAEWFGYRDVEYVHDLITKRRISKKAPHQGYIMGADYVVKEIQTANNRHAKIYFVSLDCFQDLCMRMSGCKNDTKDRAYTVRKYFRIVHNLFKDYAEQTIQERTHSAKEILHNLNNILRHYQDDPQMQELADGGSVTYLDKFTQNGHVFYHPGHTENGLGRKQRAKFEYPEAKHEWIKVHRGTPTEVQAFEDIIEALSDRWRVQMNHHPLKKECLMSQDYPADDIWEAAGEGLEYAKKRLSEKLQRHKYQPANDIPEERRSNPSTPLVFRKGKERHVIINGRHVDDCSP